MTNHLLGAINAVAAHGELEEEEGEKLPVNKFTLKSITSRTGANDADTVNLFGRYGFL